MALHSFRVENQQSLRCAALDAVPKVTVIAGPNGVGKSTLLYAIKNGGRTEDPGTSILYQGPHRVMRSSSVQRRWIGGRMRWLRDLLTGNDVSGFDGLSFGNTNRTPSNVDEVGGTIKHIMGRIENRRQTLLASTFDRLQGAGSSLSPNDLPDIYAPMRELTEFILPHLRFLKVDFSDEDNIQCLFQRIDAAGTQTIDIDSLSSGEKAVVVLFLPLLEDQLQAGLTELENFQQTKGAEAGTQEPEVLGEHRVILIDEPEQHLHPDLQAKVLGYMRRLAETTPTQFIITTHSPTILDQAFDTELFVLAPPTGDPGDNQLKRISTNAERLEALKQLAGSAYFLTTGRVVVCIEGERDADPEKPTDARLLEMLYPRATAVTLVPTTGKGNVITTVERLRQHMAEDTFRIRVKGLVDADQSDVEARGIEQLPVCMIENLLLDPDSIFEFMQEKAPGAFTDVNAVRAELKAIARDMRSKEITLRLRRRLKPKLVRLSGSTADEIKASLAEQLEIVQQMVPEETRLNAILREITVTVDGILAADRELDQFRGKELLNMFYHRHVAPLNIGYNAAAIDLARRVAARKQVSTLLDPVFDRLMAD